MSNVLNLKERNWKLEDLLYLILGEIKISNVANAMLDKYTLDLDEFDLDDPLQYDECLEQYGKFYIESIENKGKFLHIILRWV